MKLKNNIVVFDLEATCNQVNDERPDKLEYNFIIEIGAVIVSPQLEIVSSFEHLVRPEEEITPFIEKLTGISNDMVKDMPTWPEVSEHFTNWIKAHGNPKRTRLAAWNNYFDNPLLKRVYNYYDKPFPFHGYMMDVKSIAFMWASLKGLSSNELTVDEAAEKMGIIPEGKYHRALTDAKVEAEIFIKAMKDLCGGCFIPNYDGKPYKYLKVELQ
jgi:DNA polymerase III subunit alpha, Gram-positive type